MNRYGWILFRAYLPAAGALLCAVVFMFWTSLVGSTDLLKTWVPVVKWLPPVALLVALASAGIATMRMWRLREARPELCSVCGAPLQQAGAPAGAETACAACGARLPG